MGLPIYHTPRGDVVGAHVIRTAQAVTLVTAFSRDARLRALAMLTHEERARLMGQLGTFRAYIDWALAEDMPAYDVPEGIRWDSWFYVTEHATPPQFLLLAV